MILSFFRQLWVFRWLLGRLCYMICCMTLRQVRLRRKLNIWRTEIITKNYFELSANIPLKNWANILVVKKPSDQQVHEQKESSPTVTKYDKEGSQSFKQTQNLSPKNPVDLVMTKNVLLELVVRWLVVNVYQHIRELVHNYPGIPECMFQVCWGASKLKKREW